MTGGYHFILLSYRIIINSPAFVLVCLSTMVIMYCHVRTFLAYNEIDYERIIEQFYGKEFSLLLKLMICINFAVLPERVNIVQFELSSIGHIVLV